MALLLIPVLLPWFACVKTYSTATDRSLSFQQPSQTLLDFLKNNYAFSMFYAAVHRVGLDKELDSTGTGYTILLPDDDAFGRVNITLDSLMNMDTAYLRKWMGFHIVRGALGYDSIPQTVDNVFYSILGQKLFLSKPVNPTKQTPQTLHANGVAVNSFDIAASNGYIQVLNTPLNAPLEGTLQDYIDAHLDQFSLFKAALQKFDLWDSLGTDTAKPLTVFAPVNSAFENIYLQLPWLDNQYGQYTITADTIAYWNPKDIPRDVFGVYLFPGRIFTSDYTDAPASLYIMPDQQAIIYFDQGAGVAGNLIGSTYPLKQFPSAFPPPAMILNPGNYATVNGNNVLQPVGSLTMVP